VTRLSLDKDDPDRVSARIRITAETPVRIVSRASLEPQGVTGASYVQISAGDRKSPFLRGTVPEGQIPVIQASRSPFETLLAGGGDVLTRTVEVLDRVNRLISDDNVAEVSASIRDVHGLTSELRASGGVIASVRTASASITATSDKFGALADQSNRLISGDGRTSLAAIAGAATEMQDTAREVHGLVRRLDAPLSSFAIDGLPQITHTLVSVETTSDSLSRLSASLQASPMGLVAKPPAQTVEIKP